MTLKLTEGNKESILNGKNTYLETYIETWWLNPSNVLGVIWILKLKGTVLSKNIGNPIFKSNYKKLEEKVKAALVQINKIVVNILTSL